MKYMIINTPQGQHKLALELVAEHRADYYACVVDGEDRDSDSWKSEVRSAMNDKFECIDWIINNSDWSDWEKQAVKISDKVLVSEDDFWTSSEDFEIIEEAI